MKNTPNNVTNFLRLGLEVLDDPMFSPLVDTKIHEDKMTLSLPGYGKEDIRVTYKGQKLMVYVKDKLYNSFYIADTVEPDKISLKMNNGILTIDLSGSIGQEKELDIE